MRLSMISAVFAAGILALAACSGQGAVPSAQPGYAPVTSGANVTAPQSSQATADTAPETSADDASPAASAAAMSPALTTCATSPPQYLWIFKGACDQFTLKSTGGTFTLGSYDNISIKGLIGQNDLKGTAKVALADATDTGGDIETYNGHSFPAYKARGKTVVYAAANNETSVVIKPKPKQGKPILQYVITDSKGLPGKTCGAALLGQKNGKFQWTSFPGSYNVKGKTVTVTVYTAPAGFELPKKGTPLYFGINCF